MSPSRYPHVTRYIECPPSASAMWVDLRHCITPWMARVWADSRKLSETVAVCLTVAVVAQRVKRSSAIERSQKILNEIVGFLDADGQSYQSGIDPDLVQLFVRELEEAHDRRLFDQALHAAE
jgi:hypothetical protein